MGSSIPGLLEGSGIHNDDFQVTFNGSGTIAVGNVVTFFTTANQTVQTSTTATVYIVGVAITAAQLSSGYNIAMRGIVSVVTDGSGIVTAGDVLTNSATTAGRVASTGSTVTQATGFARLIALQSAAATSTTILAFLH
jgi:hypothetical protein